MVWCPKIRFRWASLCPRNVLSRDRQNHPAQMHIKRFYVLPFSLEQLLSRFNELNSVLTLHAEVPPLNGPVQTLVSWTGEYPVRRSTDSWHVMRLTCTNLTCWSLSGISGKWLDEVEPHPQRIASPVGSLSASGKPMDCTCFEVRSNGVLSLIMPMSYGATPL
jgi:hypothetical protein